MHNRFLQISFLCVVLVSLMYAQGTTSLNGTVVDPTGAVVPNAGITLINNDTAAQRETVTDNEGRYSFPQVQPGRYRVVAKAAGFNDVIVNDVRLLVNSPSTIP